MGSALCDIIIAVCMTYYVGFTHFLPLALEQNQISFTVHDGSFRDIMMIKP